MLGAKCRKQYPHRNAEKLTDGEHRGARNREEEKEKIRPTGRKEASCGDKKEYAEILKMSFTNRPTVLSRTAGIGNHRLPNGGRRLRGLNLRGRGAVVAPAAPADSEGGDGRQASIQ